MALRVLLGAQLFTPTLVYKFRCSISPLIHWRRFLAVAPESSLVGSATPQTPANHGNGISEKFVLQQLSDLLSVDAMLAPSNTHSTEAAMVEEKHEQSNVFDTFLSPEDRLRGVFLQKLRGKTAIETALSATGVDVTVEIFADVLNKGNLGGAAMVCFFDWAMKKPNLPKTVDTYKIVLKALGRRKFFGHLEDILLRMKKDGIQHDSRTKSVVIDSYVRARRVYKALDLFERLEEFGIKRDSESLHALVHSLCIRSHVRVADSMLRKMKGKIFPDRATYNVVIYGWAKLGKINIVERTWADMVADGLIPDSSTFAHHIECLGRAGRIHDAIDAFDKMEEKGCLPDAIAYNAMICNFVTVGNLEEGLKYYKYMVDRNQSPNVDTYRILIGALLKVRRVADSLELFDEMLSREICPSTSMITLFLVPLCSYGPPHAAMLLYKKSKKAGCKISLKAYKLLLMRLSRFGKCGMVLEIWEEMQKCGHLSDVEVYEYIVNGLCNNGQLDNAVLVVEESLRKRLCLGKIIYSKLNNKLLDSNKVETAYRLFLRIKEARAIANAQKFWRANGWHV